MFWVDSQLRRARRVGANVLRWAENFPRAPPLARDDERVLEGQVGGVARARRARVERSPRERRSGPRWLLYSRSMQSLCEHERRLDARRAWPTQNPNEAAVSRECHRGQCSPSSADARRRKRSRLFTAGAGVGQARAWKPLLSRAISTRNHRCETERESWYPGTRLINTGTPLVFCQPSSWSSSVLCIPRTKYRSYSL